MSEPQPGGLTWRTLWRWKMERSVPWGSKDFQASQISLNIHSQKKSRMNEQKAEVTHLNRMSDLSQASDPEPIN